MKRMLPILLSLAVFSIGTARAAEPAKTIEKFYGKITAVNVDAGDLTVFNASRKLEGVFRLNADTRVIRARKPIPQSDLAVGQNLIVYFDTLDDDRFAKKITVRRTRRKKAAND